MSLSHSLWFIFCIIFLNFEFLYCSLYRYSREQHRKVQFCFHNIGRLGNLRGQKIFRILGAPILFSPNWDPFYSLAENVWNWPWRDEACIFILYPTKDVYCRIQSVNILLVPPKCKIVMVPSIVKFFNIEIAIINFYLLLLVKILFLIFFATIFI